jgi:serine protease Do
MRLNRGRFSVKEVSMYPIRRTAVLWAVAVLAVVSLLGPAGKAFAAPDRKAELKDVLKLYDQTRPYRELYIKTAEYVTPAVVSITTTRTITEMAMPNMPNIPGFPFPWGGPNQRMPNQPREREIPEHGLGSGFVIDAKDGWIVTNAHVVRDVKAEDIQVVFSDGREATAKAVFSDSNTDVAVVQVAPDGLVQLEWGNDEEVLPAESVMAIGSPMGFGNSITSGIISAPSTKSRYFAGGRRNSLRANENPYAIEDYIQTDAAINPGNSGGPLVTLDAKVIGINSLIVSNSMASAGLGFAVPARIARPVVEQLIANGKVVRGHLGVSIINPSDIDDQSAKQLFDVDKAADIFKQYNIKSTDEGAFVADVIPTGPAGKAGLKRGDLIVSVAGRKTPDVDVLREQIASIRPGTQIDLGVKRDGRDEKVEVVIGEQPENAAAAWAQAPGEGITSKPLGLSVQTLTPDISEALGYAPDLKGVIVTAVEKDGPADQAGVRRNDIILQVGQDEVADVQSFQNAVDKMAGRSVAFLLRRGDAQRFVTVKPAE